MRLISLLLIIFPEDFLRIWEAVSQESSGGTSHRLRKRLRGLPDFQG